ncbi:hypothetical protein [Flavobacterium sp.]|uniref:hypothetical protein n=1 Tax=Flavobacterium sp. TaxID=239 RepID=UPI0037BFDEC6
MMAQTGGAQAQAPQQPAPAPQQPTAAPAAQAPKQTRLDRLLGGYDQFATGSTDPGSLNPQQRSLMRRQLAMNIGGALSAGQPIAAGVQAHQTGLAEQAEKAEAMRRQQALQEAIAGNGAPAPMPLSGEGGESPQGVALRQQQRAGMTAQIQRLLSAGYVEEADMLSRQMDRMFPEVTYSTLNAGDRSLGIDPISGEPVAAYDHNPTEYQQWLMQKGQAGGGGGGVAAAPPVEGDPRFYTDPVTGRRFYHDGRGWKQVTGVDAGAGGASNPVGNERQQTGAALALTSVFDYTSELTGTPVEELRTMTDDQIRQLILTKGKRTFQGPILGNLPFLAGAANADLLPYSAGAGAGTAMMNNPVGPIVEPDQKVGERMSPNPAQPLTTQANLIIARLRAARGERGVGNLPTPGRAIKRTGTNRAGQRVIEYTDGTREVQ